MSNQLSKLKCVKSKKIQKNDIRRAMNNQKATTINFMDRVIPNSLVIDVKKSDIRIGNETDKIKDIEVAFNAGVMNDDDSAKLIEFLAQFNEDTIQKVILDNTENFKIMKLNEFIDLINKKIIDKDNPATDSKEALTYVNVGRIIFRSIIDKDGNIFCITAEDYLADYRLVKFDAQLNRVAEIDAKDINLSEVDEDNVIQEICRADDGIALLVVNDDDKYIVRYDKDLNCVSKLVLDCNFDVHFATLLYHNSFYYCTGLIDFNESFVRIYDMELILIEHIKINDDDKVFVLNNLIVVDDTIYTIGAICNTDGNDVGGLIMMIDYLREVKRYSISFNEKYGFVTDIKYNFTTNQFVVAGISSDNDKHFKLITMIMNLDLSLVKAKAFISEDLTLDSQSNPKADHQLVVLGNGEIMSSAYCKMNLNDKPVGAMLLLHHSADLGLIETKMMMNPVGTDTVGFINKYQDDIVITFLDMNIDDTEFDDSAIMKINHAKLFSTFYPTLSDGNPVPALAQCQTDCRSFSVEESLVTIVPV